MPATLQPKTLTGNIVKTFVIDAPPRRVFKAFTSIKDLRNWMEDNATIEARKGGTFQIGRKEDGNTITGEILDFVPNKKIVYTWELSEYDKKTHKLLKNWSHENPSKFTVKFSKSRNGTKIAITHVGFPEMNEEYWMHEVGHELIFGEVLKYYLEHSKSKFDLWWKEQEPTWQKRWQKIAKERMRAARGASKIE